MQSLRATVAPPAARYGAVAQRAPHPALKPGLSPAYRGKGLSIGLGAFTGQTSLGPNAIAQEYRSTLAIAQRAEALGFDAMWFSEHHGAPDGYYPSLLPQMAAVAAVTKTIRLATGTLLPALHNPLRLAKQIAVVDHLSAGRVVLGFGAGWRRQESSTFGVPHEARSATTGDMIRHLRSEWLSSWRAARVPGAFSEQGPPILLYGSNDDAIRSAGALADGLIYSLAGPTAALRRPTLGDVRSALALADRQRRAIGLSEPIPLVLLTNALISASKGARSAWNGIDHMFACYGGWQDEEDGQASGSMRTESLIHAGRKTVFCGSAHRLAEQLATWTEGFASTRPVHLVVKLNYPGMELQDVIEGIEAFAEHVMPRLMAPHVS